MSARSLALVILLCFPVLPIVIFGACCSRGTQDTSSIPLPEHPRPDFMRAEWLNLNGAWDFALDSLETGESNGWQRGDVKFPMRITVPFSWAAPLSGVGVKDVHMAWYARGITVPRAWKGKRVFFVVGACDFAATVWLNGKKLGVHEGGYVPFEFDLTDSLKGNRKNRMVIRVEDKPTPGRLVGKQVYGDAKGIWQTVYLEARPQVHIRTIRFVPDVEGKRVRAEVSISNIPNTTATVSIEFPNGETNTGQSDIPPAGVTVGLDIPIRNPRLWSLEDPYLYEVDVVLFMNGKETDRVRSYFGMRSIGTAPLPGSKDRYVTLNGKPLYLKMTLDQSYHPEGFYTFPSDEFMRGEIERAKHIGLNALRIHIKTEIPRKLYWADRLGILLMCDIPHIGGEPDDYGRKNWEATAWGQIERDFNHPAIFSWVLFNESWGLTTKGEYRKETQEWVKGLYARAKRLDPTRLVEDNSPDQGRRWHVASDLNSWHAYLPGYRWTDYMDGVVKNTFPGSPWNYIEPYVQPDIPMLNSECGNVWGYKGGTGDVDISYEYHLMMNEYRKRPKICGFLFTEFHDVINEWNGYYRYDRSEKDWGLSDLCPGMTVRDFHRDLYLIPGADFKKTVHPGERFIVPIKASLLADVPPGEMTVRTLLHGWNRLGEHRTYAEGRFTFTPKPYAAFDLPPVKIAAPDEECLALFCTYLVGANGDTLHANFTPIRVLRGDSPRRESLKGTGEVIRCAPGAFSNAEWSVKRKSVLDGLKVWGTGTGYFEYTFPWPRELDPARADSVVFIAELASRRIQGKDMVDSFVSQGIEQVSRKGIDPGHNPNSYPMTDTRLHPSVVTITLNGLDPRTVTLNNDPADHRGILSWLAQREDGNLSEAGSYGYLVRVTFEPEAVKKAEEEKRLVVRLAVEKADDRSGGLSVYSERFGRYPIDPTVVVKAK